MPKAIKKIEKIVEDETDLNLKDLIPAEDVPVPVP